MSINRYIAKQFSNPTGIGGKLVSSVMNKQNRPLYEDALRLLSPSGSDSVLDIGCGNGYVLNMLANHSECKLTGIDFSQSAIKTAFSRNRMFVDNGRMNLVCLNLHQLPFPDYAFDKAYTINTVYFWENLADTLSGIRRVLKPKGLFINALYTNETLDSFSHTEFGYKRIAPTDLRVAGENARFSVDVVPALNGKAYCVVCRRED